VNRESEVVRRRRLELKPDQVRILLVGESAPAGGSHYYRANSILFGAIRDAARRSARRPVPDGARFLTYARDRGLWLVDLAARPVNNLDVDTRRDVVRRGIPRVSRLLAECDPEFVVAIGTTYVASPAAVAVQRSKISTELIALPFPVRQWREDFVAGLARVLTRSSKMS
jgi:hypothetical protein